MKKVCPEHIKSSQKSIIRPTIHNFNKIIEQTLHPKERQMGKKACEKYSTLVIGKIYVKIHSIKPQPRAKRG